MPFLDGSIRAHQPVTHRRRCVLRRLALVALVAGVATSAQSCDGGATTDPTIHVASIVVTPATLSIIKDHRVTLTLTLFDSTGGSVPSAEVTWASLSPGVVSVSGTGEVVAEGYGPAEVIATVGTHVAMAKILVTAPPTTAAFTVTELSPAPTASPSRLTDSALVLAGNLIYRDGVGSVIPGCTPIDLNNRSHVLCFDGSTSQTSAYSLWSDGLFTPLAASDTFHAAEFNPGNYPGIQTAALNDSDVVLGAFYRPTFVNPGCPAGEGMCIVYWKDGQPTFPGVVVNGVNWRSSLNNRRDFIVQCLTCNPKFPLADVAPFLFLASTGKKLAGPSSINDFSDVASMAVGESSAYFATPQGMTRLGDGSATGINDANAVVGTLADFGPFLWTGAGVHNLTHATVDPSWTVVDARKINDRGQILAKADNADGRKAVWVILTPTQP